MIQVLLGELSEQETEVILRPFRSDLVAHNGESVGHDSWGDSGDNVYASAFGGRQPQGLWRSDLQGNEECVLAGASISQQVRVCWRFPPQRKRSTASRAWKPNTRSTLGEPPRSHGSTSMPPACYRRC